jgi:hypothetical protein
MRFTLTVWRGERLRQTVKHFTRLTRENRKHATPNMPGFIYFEFDLITIID